MSADTSQSDSQSARDFARGDFSLGWRGRLIYAAMLLLMIFYPLLIVAIAVGLSAGAVWLLFRLPSAWVIAMALMSIVTSVTLLASLALLFWRLQLPAPFGLWLRRDSNRTAFELIDRVARRLRITPPELVVILPGMEASISPVDLEEDGRRRKAHALVIGAQDVLNSNVSEFTATICHELAHAAAGDTRLGRILHRFYLSLVSAASVREDEESDVFSLPAWLAHLTVAGFLHLFTLLYLANSRAQEYRADRVAAQICGPQRTRDMLRKTIRVGHLPELDIWTIAAKAVNMEPQPKNLYDILRERMRSVPKTRLEAAENEAFQAPASVWHTHPNLADRFRRLSEVSGPELASERPASDLFTDWARIEKSLSEMVMDFAAIHQRMQDQQVERILPR